MKFFSHLQIPVDLEGNMMVIMLSPSLEYYSGGEEHFKRAMSFYNVEKK